MDISNKPMETLQQWQEWYRANRKVASLDEPLVSKESRENLHDTVNAVDALPDWRTHYKELISDMETNNDIFKQKATEYFNVGPEQHCATFHHGKCGVCGTTNIAVTEPRDYGYLRTTS